MKKSKVLILVVHICLNSSPENRDWINFNDTRLFTKGNPENEAAVDFDDSRWEIINIPNDWAIYGPFDKEASGNTGKLPWKGEGWYRKTFTVDMADEGKVVYFLFDSIMAFPEIYINGKLAEKWDQLKPDRTTVSADGEDLSYLLVEAYDKVDNLCPLADNLVEFYIKGPGRIAGDGYGDQRSYEPFQALYRKLFNGKAMLILRSRKNNPGEIEVTATSNGLQSNSIKIISR